jgi:hypothetical protein
MKCWLTYVGTDERSKHPVSRQHPVSSRRHCEPVELGARGSTYGVRPRSDLSVMIALALVAFLLIGTVAVLFVRTRRGRSPEPDEGQAPLVLPDPVGVVRVMRVEPTRTGGAAAVIVAVERGRVAPGDILLMPYFNREDVVVDKTVVSVEPLPGADDRGLLRVRVRPTAGLEVEEWAADSLLPDTLLEVFDRAPAA